MQTLMAEASQLVVGVSGGADSVALLHLLHQLGFRPTVAHINHQLRGEASDADETFVKARAESLQLPFKSTRVDVQALADEKGVSIEMAARAARHHFFSTWGPHARVALAHHADDQAETFLLRLARGTGPEGLSGMRTYQQIGALHLIRPMLNLTRTQILVWLNERNISWREDASNGENDYLRNRIRNTILPMLEQELSPTIRQQICRTMAILRDENELLDKAAEMSGIDSLDTQALLQEPIALARRKLRNWLFSHHLPEIDFATIETILTRCKSPQGTAYFPLNATTSLVFEYGVLRIQSNEQQPVPQWTLTRTTGTGWKKDHGKGAGILPAEASFSAEKIGANLLELRRVRPGDRMQPLGMLGSKKLQDIFTDQKIPREMRPKIPIVTCNEEIIWIPGYRTARGWEVEHSDAPAVHLRVEIKR
jgi:tRNA(Ile)-lysidine synthase